ncbi:hypothetical protein SDC9_118733 [bioreactor metagenome]|uniref:Uncharacterized protein n=1 Tax=bioreactor metagenome TaxID=1076179 RepID=A0A645C2A1_9ZZZZ
MNAVREQEAIEFILPSTTIRFDQLANGIQDTLVTHPHDKPGNWILFREVY